MTAEPRESYYGLPVVNHPVWTWEIPVYFFTGGLAGASAPLAAVAAWRGQDALARRAAAAALAGAMVSPALLISDLGVPRRFLNMLRVLKVTSPMSVGAWILAGFGPSAAAQAGYRFGLLPRAIGVPGEAAAAVLGPLLATYTAALIADTAVPAWHEGRRELPFVFAGSSLAAAGGLAAALTPGDEAGPARRLAIAGAALELGATRLMERRLEPVVRVAYEQGPPARLMRAAKALGVAGGAAMAVAGGRSRVAAAIAGGALLAGSFAERWGIFRAGFASADDPAATVRPQRRRARATS